MNDVDIKCIIGFSLLDAFFWAFIASFSGFISTYFLDCGMTSSFLSVLLAVSMIFSFSGSFFWGRQCDRFQTNKKVFMPEILAASIIALIIFNTVKINLWIPTILFPIFSFLSAPLASNLDAWMLKRFHKDTSIYGKVRSIGSIGYAFSALLVGISITNIGFIV